MTTGIRVGANASETRLALVKETAFGTTPSSPSFATLRITSENLQPTKETVRSNEIRADRNVVDEIMVGRQVAGDINFELSDGVFEDLMASALFNDWSGSPADTLKNGNGLGTSFSAERTIELPSGSSEYHRFKGLIANTFNLNVTAGQVITGSFGMMGLYGSRGTSTLSGATYANAATERVMNAANHFASLTVAGTSPSPRIQALTLSCTNNLRGQREVGNLDAAGYGAGRFEVTGTMNCYFEDGALYQSFIDHDDLSLSFVLGIDTGKKYRITLPTIILTGEPGANAGGNDEDLMMNLAFTAVLDRLSSPLLACALQIERNVS